MATARKTPSGMWRVRSYSYTDEQGKKHYASFTASTKAQAEQKAAAFDHKKRLKRRNDYTCSEAIGLYLEKLPGDISPSTLRGYHAIQKRILSHGIASIRINLLSDDDLQDFVNELQREGFSAKTVQSTYSFLMSSIQRYSDQRYHIKLPKIHRPPKTAPSDADVQLLISEADPQLRNAIYLAAFGSLRRGEVAGLKFKDINKKKNTITVHSDIVLSPSKEWIHKDHPKTDASYRTVELPREIFEALGDGQPDDYVIALNPGTISDRFRALKKRLDISIRFHDLRGYCASIMAALGISDTYAQRRGGWSSSGVLKSVYQNVITEHEKQISAQLNNHFSSMLKNV
jgi:integrase